MLENILNTEDTEIDEYLKNKEQKDQRQQELLNQILTG
jgi:phosphoribosyl-dephospho-CoA transferase